MKIALRSRRPGSSSFRGKSFFALLPAIVLTILVMLAATRTAQAAPPQEDVVVYSYVSDAGRKLTPPTADKPVYYMLVDGGYHQMGDTFAGEKTPDPVEVERLVRHALATSNYRGASNTSPQIEVVSKDGKHFRTARVDQVIVYYWGSLGRSQIESDDPEVPNTDLNTGQMMGLVGGKELAQMLPQEAGRAELMAAAGVDRYFVIISAFAVKPDANKKKILLWRAQLSGSMSGTTLGEVIPGFLTAGAPFFGRETGIPKMSNVDLGHQGQVEVGTPTVEEYLPTVKLPPEEKPKPRK